MKKQLNDWDKFKAILWKNVTSQMNRKMELFVTILTALIFMPVIVIIRIINIPEMQKHTVYEPVQITDLKSYDENIAFQEKAGKLPIRSILYSPRNDILEKIIQDAAQRLQIDNYKSYDRRADLKHALAEHNYLVGVAFNDHYWSIETYPTNFTYALEFSGILRTNPSVRHPKVWKTDKLTRGESDGGELGPRNKETNEDGMPTGYIQEGFIAVQHAVAMAYLEQASEQKFGDIDIRRFAYPRYLYDPLAKIIKVLLPICIVFVYMYPCHYIVKLITIERENDLKANMQIMGIRNYIHWTAWFLQLFVIQGIVTILTTFCLSYTWYANVSIYLYSDWIPILFFMMFYTVSNITFTFALAAIFTKSTTANLYASVLHLSTYSVYIFSDLFYDQIPFWCKLICCMFLNTGLAMGQMIILDFESTGEGLQWNKINLPHSPTDELCLSHIMIMLLVAAVIHMIICLYVEKINPGRHGIAEPWYYPFQFSYWKKACFRLLFMPNAMMPRRSIYFDAEGSTDDERRDRQQAPKTDQANQSALSEDEMSDEPTPTTDQGNQSTLSEDEIKDDRVLAAERNAAERIAAVERAAEERIREIELDAARRIKEAEDAAKQHQLQQRSTRSLRLVSIQPSKTSDFDPPSDESLEIKPAFYNEPLKDPNVGIQLIEVNKKYGPEWVIRDVTMNCHPNEITAILGQPKSGKTTLVKMIIGSYKMTKGTILINGNDIRTNLKAARRDLGILPSHNIIFDDLTPLQHLHFYCFLRGVPRGKSMRKEIRMYLQMMAMMDLADMPAKNLTEGMARRLSLCCALCGGTTSVICNDLTQYLDTGSKQRLWQLLKTHKKDRTIIVATESEQEAMAIADRIAVLYDGKIQCYNTKESLKNDFLTDYYMSCVKENDQCDAIQVTSFLRNHIKEVHLLTDKLLEFFIKIPGNQKIRYPAMLQELDNNATDLHIQSYQLKTLSLSDVFMRVRGSYFSQQDSIIMLSERRMNTQPIYTELQRWKALFYKKCCYHKRNWWFFTLVILVPALSVIVQALFDKETIKDLNLKPLPIEMTMYTKGLLALKKDRDLDDDSFESKVCNEYEDYATSLGEKFRFKPINYKRSTDTFVLTEARHSVLVMENEFLASLEVKSNSYQASWNNQHFHTVALSLTLLHKALAKAALGDEAEIHLINDPVHFTPSEHLYLLEMSSGLNIGLANNVVIGFSFVMAIIAIPIVRDRLDGTKTLQFMSGVTMPVYWIQQFLWNQIQYTLTVLFTIFVFWVLRIPNYSSGPALFRIFIVMMIFGLSGIPYTYIRVFMFSNARVAFFVLFIQSVTMSVLIVLLLVALEVRGYIEKAEDYYPYFRIFSMINLFMALKHLHIGNEMRLVCKDILRDDPKCTEAPKCCEIPGYFAWKYPGVLKDILNMILLGILYTFILVLLDSEWFRSLLVKTILRPKRPKDNKDNKETIDDDVLTEKENTLALDSKEMKNKPLVVKEAYKKKKGKVIIQNISLTVSPNECMCILGAYNMGKNFFVKLITGKQFFTWGDAFYKGHSITYNRSQAYLNIGYCPKKSALYDDLTASETIRFFCMLKGMPQDAIKGVVTQLSDLLKMGDVLNVCTRKYKQSDKRKLSIAIAMIGPPTIMIIAEPTAGADSETRLIVWRTLNMMRDHPDKSALLVTTDMIEEAEILSSRLGILVDGKLKCIGLLSHLNTKYSMTYSLVIIESKEGMYRRNFDPEWYDDDMIEDDLLSNGPEQKDGRPHKSLQKYEHYEPVQNQKDWAHIAANYHNIKVFFTKEVPAAKLSTEYQNCLIYHIPLKSMLWWEIFDMMESIKEPFLLEDYVLSQSDLEEIYQDFNTIAHTEDRIKKKRATIFKRLWKRIRRA